MVIDRNWLLWRAFLVFLILLTPLIEGILVKNQDKYSHHPDHVKQLDYIGRKIFDPGPDIDMLFLGPSTLWSSINASLLETKLREMNHTEEISVQNFGHKDKGFDLDYFTLLDLLGQKKVKTLFLSSPNASQFEINRITRYIWDPLHHSAGLPASMLGRLYAEKILESSQTLFRFYVARPVIDPRVYKYISRRNGTLYLPWGFGSPQKREPFTRKTYKPLNISLDDWLLDAQEMRLKGEFSPLQAFFLKKIYQLASEHGIRVYIVTPPGVYDEMEDTVPYIGSQSWIGPRLDYVGVPMKRLFPGMGPEELKKYIYFDATHFNQNGADYYSASILPAMQEIYLQSKR